MALRETETSTQESLMPRSGGWQQNSGIDWNSHKRTKRGRSKDHQILRIKVLCESKYFRMLATLFLGAHPPHSYASE